MAKVDDFKYVTKYHCPEPACWTETVIYVMVDPGKPAPSIDAPEEKRLQDLAKRRHELDDCKAKRAEN
jgi:hypothetical protein